MRLITAMVDGGDARAGSFFLSHGLGPAYYSLGRGYSIRARVNAALNSAEAQERLDTVLQAGLGFYDLGDSVAEDDRTASRIGDSATNMNGQLFISHASADEELADSLTDLLRLGTDLTRERIVCTSLDGMSIPVGTMDYLEHLRKSLTSARLVLPLITPAFFDSEVCLIEIGAMWGMRQETFPLLVPPIDFPRMEGLLGKVQAAKIDTPGDLSRLHDIIVRAFGLRPDTAMWEGKKVQFERKLPSLLKGLAPARRRSAADFEEAVERGVALQQRVEVLTGQLDELREQNRRLLAAKTADQAVRALAPPDEIARFQSAVRDAKELMDGLSRAVRTAIYEDHANDQPYRPARPSSEAADAERALRQDLLTFNEESGYFPNDGDPTIEAALGALSEVFEVHWSPDLKAWFRNNYNKNFTASSQPVWEALGLL